MLESKQGVDARDATEAERLGLGAAERRKGIGERGSRAWKRKMEKAKNQAFRYARALPDADGWPPFLLVVDAGYCIDLYADFARQGKNYVPFPDKPSHRVVLDDLRDAGVRATLRQVY